MSKKIKDTLIKKDDYKKLKPLQNDIKNSLSSKSVSKFERSDLKTIEDIFYDNGGSRRLKIFSCNSCVLTIFEIVSHWILNYEERYYNKNKKD